MSQDLVIINPLVYPSWDDLLIPSKNASFFHSSEWARVISESYRYKPLYFARINRNKLQTLVPLMEVKSILTGKRGVSLPFTDYCESITDEGESLHEIINELIEYGKSAGWRFIELRCGNCFPEDITFYSLYYAYIMHISEDENHIFSTFRDSTRRNIRKSAREGVEVKILSSLESVKEFYRLNCMTRKEHGLPPQPYYFFKKIYQYIISKGRGFVVLASFNDEIIAGAIFFHFANKAIYKYGASNRKYINLRANNLVMWEAIKWLSRNKYNSLSFGRTDQDNEGLRRFKKGWGTTEVAIKYYKYDMSKKTFISKPTQESQVPSKIFSRMPQFLLRTTGSLLYRHIG